MVPSKYNHIFSKGNKSYWFNTLTHKYFCLSKELGEKLEKILPCPEQLEKVSGLLETLRGGGFIVPHNFDETAHAITLNQEACENQHYMLTLMPTLNCNFKCPYCIQNHIPSIMNKNVETNICRHIDYMIEEKKISSLGIEWFGGEPFMALHNTVSNISKYAIERCRETGIPFVNTATTNGFYLTPNVIPLIEELQFSRFQITIYGHRELHNKIKFQKGCESTFDRVLNNINELIEGIPNLKIILRINYTKETVNQQLVNQLSSIIREDKRNHIQILLKKVWQEKMTQEDYNPIRNFALSLTHYGFSVNMTDLVQDYLPCYVNRKFYNCISYNGSVYKCTACDDIYDASKGGKLKEDGDIWWPNALDKKSIQKSFNNEICLDCKFLPICYGVCPRDYLNGLGYCKLNQGMDINMRISNLIDFKYESLKMDHPV